MAAVSQIPRVKFETTTTGTSDLAVGSGIDSTTLGDGLTPAEAGITNGETVMYYVIDGGSWAYGIGTYNTTGPVITRATNETHWNGSTLSTSGKRSLAAGTKTVFFAPQAESLVNIDPVTGQLLPGNGGAGTPPYSFDNDASTGIFGDGAGKVGISSGGSQVAAVSSGAQFEATHGFLSGANGSAGAPAYSSTADTDTGIFFPAADQIAISAGAVEMMHFVEGATDYIETNVPIYMPYGSAGAPSLTFSSDTDTGIYGSAGTVYVGAGGTQIGLFDSIGLSMGSNLAVIAGAGNGYFSAPDGVVSGPAYRFGGLGGLSTGLYHPADDQMSIAAGGVQMMNFVEGATDYIDAKVPIYIPSGTAGAPGLAFSANTDCGLIYEATGIVTVVAEGSKIAYFSNGLTMVAGKDFYLSQSGHTVPSTSSDTGFPGALSWDASYIYVCTATDTWKRVAIATW